MLLLVNSDGTQLCDIGLNKVGDLEKRVRDLEHQLQAEKDNFYSRMAGREDEIRRLKIEISEMMQEYQDLMDTKIQLDVEIAAYRKLLEAEESRLNMSNTSQSHTSSFTSVSKSGRAADKRSATLTAATAASGAAASDFSAGGFRGAKRKRFSETTSTSRAEVSFGKTRRGAGGDFEAAGGSVNGFGEDAGSGRYTYQTSQHHDGAIEIMDHDTDGEYVKLVNRSDEDMVVGHWQLKRTAGEDEVIYKFHPSLKLKAGKTTTVWSSDAEVTHSPPSDLVMKNQKWPVGDSIRSSLVTDEDEEVAWRESERSVSGATTQHMVYRTGGTGDIGLQSAAGGVNGEDQRCSIM